MDEPPPAKRQHLLPSQHSSHDHLDPLVGSTSGYPTPAISAGAGFLSPTARESVWREDMSAAAAALLCIGSSQGCGQGHTSGASQFGNRSHLRSVSSNDVPVSAARESGTWAAGAAAESGRPALRSSSMPLLGRSRHSSRAGSGADANGHASVSGKLRKSKAASTGQLGQEQTRCKCGMSSSGALVPSPPSGACTSISESAVDDTEDIVTIYRNSICCRLLLNTGIN